MLSESPSAHEERMKLIITRIRWVGMACTAIAIASALMALFSFFLLPLFRNTSPSILPILTCLIMIFVVLFFSFWVEPLSHTYFTREHSLPLHTIEDALKREMVVPPPERILASVAVSPQRSYVPYPAPLTDLLELSPDFPPLRPEVPSVPPRVVSIPRPGQPRHFSIPKAGELALDLCQDRLQWDNKRYRYAVADGATAGFVSGQWAEIIAQAFVEQKIELYNRERFQNWLRSYSNEWHQYVEKTWIPTVNERLVREGRQLKDWRNEIRKGAQTTLIGCSIVAPDPGDDELIVNVLAIGDCECLLLRPDHDGTWFCKERFPYTTSAQFTSNPHTLATRSDLQEDAWKWRKIKTLHAQSGDQIILASDAFARWLLLQMEDGMEPWKTILAEDFGEPQLQRLINEECEKGWMDDDDVSLLIIPIIQVTPHFDEAK